MSAYRTTSQRPRVAGSTRVNVGTRERLGSAVAGTFLTVLGLRRMSLNGLLAAGLGGVLLYRGTTGYCPLNEAIGRDTSDAGARRALELTESLTVAAPREDVYAFWRELENLPRFMEHLEKVYETQRGRSHWTARAPGDAARIEWNAELTAEEPNERLAWRSLPGADVDNAGEVRFRDAPGGRGTEVDVRIAYRPPAGDVGRVAARVLGPAFDLMVRNDIRRFKHMMEVGRAPTTEGQPQGA